MEKEEGYQPTKDNTSSIPPSESGTIDKVHDPVLRSITITENDFEMLKIIRGYFGKNDVTGLEHMAYAVLDRVIKKQETP